MFPDVDADVAATDATELKARIDAGEPVAILDTRETDAYQSWNISAENVQAVNIPYHQFMEGLTPELESELPNTAPGQSIYVVCGKGISSVYVAELLVAGGYDATNLDDGMEGWATLYEYGELRLPSGTLVRQYQRPSSGCLGYMIISEGSAAVVDPLRAFTDRYVADAAAADLSIDYVLDTHVHADHISGLRELAEESGAVPVAPAGAIARGMELPEAGRVVEGGERLVVGGADLAVRHTPGHTSGMTTYRVDDSVALTGDALFIDSVARPDLEEGAAGAEEAAAVLYETLQERLLSLPDDTLIAPAHHSGATAPRADGTYMATVGELTESLALLGANRETFVQKVLADMPPRPANFQEIIETNLGERVTSPAEAFTMELGPNNCAAGSAATEEDATESTASSGGA